MDEQPLISLLCKTYFNDKVLELLELNPEELKALDKLIEELKQRGEQ